MAEFALTPQQSAIVTHAVAGEDLLIEAGAGAGKTSTLVAVANAMLDSATVSNGLYIGFNKVTATEAKGRFPARFDCRTGHSLAFHGFGSKIKHKLPGKNSQRPKMRSLDLAKALGIEAVEIDGADGQDARWLQPDTRVILAGVTVDRFCRSDRPELSEKDVPWFSVPQGINRAQFGAAVLDAARTLWADYIDPEGVAQTPHDVYRKQWALSEPRLRAGVIMLDEAQDTAPVLAKVIKDQKRFGAQIIVVGDSCQQLYAWAGAVDALANWGGDATRLYLTTSFRFGPAIAAEANKWLESMDRPLRISGWDGVTSVVDDDADQTAVDAILCRTNVGALGHVLTQQNSGRKVALVGGGNEIRAAAFAALALMAGRRTDHPELCVFDSWEEVVKTVQADETSSLRPLVGMIEAYGPHSLIEAVGALVSEEYADVVISTGHKAKGREWHTVLISQDFAPRKSKDEDGADVEPSWTVEDKMLNYVAVTRAKKVLIRGPLAAIDELISTPV